MNHNCLKNLGEEKICLSILESWSQSLKTFGTYTNNYMPRGNGKSRFYWHSYKARFCYSFFSLVTETLITWGGRVVPFFYILLPGSIITSVYLIRADAEYPQETFDGPDC